MTEARCVKELDWDGHEWHSLVRRVAQLSKRADAEDLLHSAYLRYCDRKRDTNILNLKAFLIRTAVNLGIDEYRREKRSNFQSVDSIPAAYCRERMPAQDEAISHRETLFRVTHALSRLNPRTSEILMMHRFDGLTYRQIADKLNITPSAVEKHIAKAMQVLARTIE